MVALLGSLRLEFLLVASSLYYSTSCPFFRTVRSHLWFGQHGPSPPWNHWRGLVRSQREDCCFYLLIIRTVAFLKRPFWQRADHHLPFFWQFFHCLVCGLSLGCEAVCCCYGYGSRCVGHHSFRAAWVTLGEGAARFRDYHFVSTPSDIFPEAPRFPSLVRDSRHLLPLKARFMLCIFRSSLRVLWWSSARIRSAIPAVTRGL